MTKSLASFLALAAAATLPALAQSASSSIPAAHVSTAGADKAVATYFSRDSVADVNLGRLALGKTQNAAIRRTAQAMVTDHTKTAQQAMRLAKQVGASDAELKPSDDGELVYAHLASESGATFEKDWTKDVVDAHKTDISLVNDALDVVKTPAVKQYLQSTLAVDQKHLQLAEQAQKEQGG